MGILWPMSSPGNCACSPISRARPVASWGSSSLPGIPICGSLLQPHQGILPVAPVVNLAYSLTREFRL